MLRPLVTVRGPVSPEYWRNTKRAQELCDQGNAPAELVHQVLNGLFSYYVFVANMEMAHRLAGQILALGEEHGDQIVTSTGHMGLGITRSLMGEFRAAVTSLEQSIAICEGVLPTCPDFLLRPVMTNLINSRGMLSEALWVLGYPEQALRQIKLFHRLPRNLRGSFDIATSMLYDLRTGCLLIRDYTQAHQRAETLSALAKENGFTSMEAHAGILLGHVAVEQGATDEGIKALLQASETLKAAGEIMLAPSDVFTAQAFLTAGRPAEGLAAVDDAIATAQQLHTCLSEAELHRLKGELLLLAGAAEGEAEASMRRAIEITQRQDAKAWELRAATGLARLLRDNNRRDEARAMLTEIYSWFTEGFETADLKDAKTLLDELAQ